MIFKSWLPERPNSGSNPRNKSQKRRCVPGSKVAKFRMVIPPPQIATQGHQPGKRPRPRAFGCLAQKPIFRRHSTGRCPATGKQKGKQADATPSLRFFFSCWVRPSKLFASFALIRLMLGLRSVDVSSRALAASERVKSYFGVLKAKGWTPLRLMSPMRKTKRMGSRI